jgi:hypothetical protein
MCTYSVAPEPDQTGYGVRSAKNIIAKLNDSEKQNRSHPDPHIHIVTLFR